MSQPKCTNRRVAQPPLPSSALSSAFCRSSGKIRQDCLLAGWAGLMGKVEGLRARRRARLGKEDGWAGPRPGQQVCGCGTTAPS